MSQERELANRMSRLLVASDTLFFAQAVFSEQLEPIRSNMMLALSSLVSMYIVESEKWARDSGLTGPQDTHQFEADLQNSRQRIKLLSDTRRSMAEIEGHAVELARINQEWYENLHLGIFSRLRRWRQKDLGLYFIEEQVFNTTDVAFLDLGIPREKFEREIRDHEALGLYGRELGVEAGRHLGWLLTSICTVDDVCRIPAIPTPPPVGYCDLHSDRFYADVASRAAPQRPTLGFVLTSILSTVNTARLLLPLLKGHEFLALLKWQFVSLYQAILNLQRVRDEHFRGPKYLTNQAVERINDVLSVESVQIVRRQKILRNALVHYTVRDREAKLLHDEYDLFGFFEACTSGWNAHDIATHVDQGLNEIGPALNSLVVPGYRAEGIL